MASTMTLVNRGQPLECPCRQCLRLFRPTAASLERGSPYWWYCAACQATGNVIPAGMPEPVILIHIHPTLQRTGHR